MSSYARQQLEDFLKTIDVKADNVLDIGGSQLPIKGRTKSWEVKDYKILDLEQPHECKQKPDIIMDLNGFSMRFEKSFEPELYFDIAFCLEVSEYWYDPINALKRINSFLKQGGILYISFHEIYPLHNPKENDYLRYTFYGISKLLEEAGFDMIEKIPRMFKCPENYHLLIKQEGMKPCREWHHNISGYIIKAIKI